MEEYTIENGSVPIDALKAPFMNIADYTKAHESLVIFCHDVFIQYEGGLLLVKRKNHPGMDELWPIGGRVQRGIPTELSLREKTWAEAHLELENIIELGCGRTYFSTDPFGHGKGTDTFNLTYFAQGKGSLNLDDVHEEPFIITEKTYPEVQKTLHPYVKDFLEKALSHLTR